MQCERNMEAVVKIFIWNVNTKQQKLNISRDAAAAFSISDLPLHLLPPFAY